MRVESDAWLSEILGYDVFSVSLDNDERTSDLRLLSSHQDRSERAFYYAKVPTSRVAALPALQSLGFNVVDVQVTFVLGQTQPEGPTTGDIVVVDDIPAAHDGAVLDIAASTFEYSRFHLDPAIPDEFANTIKREWVGNYIRKKRGELLTVAMLGDKPVGFLAVFATTLQGQGWRIIDLISVHRQYQGRGVGKALVSSFIRRYADSGTFLRVGTQAANVVSMRLYERCGFLVDSTAFVMHAHVNAGEADQ